VYLEEARRLSVLILPLDINESSLEFLTGRESIRVGFSAVKNLSRRTVGRILSERAKKPFDGLADFLSRVDTAKSECESLIYAGAFSGLGRTRPECLFELDALFNSGAAALEQAHSTKLSEYSLAEILAFEDETMEMTPTAHPMTPFVAAARERGASQASQIPRFRGKVATLAGFIVTRRRAPTKNGEYMEFATFEDETDIFEVTLFPDAYRRFGRLLRSAGPFLIKGKVEDQYGALTITAAWLDYLLGDTHRPERIPVSRDETVRDFAPPPAQLFLT
jgi:DNA polymerase III alpha subunit